MCVCVCCVCVVCVCMCVCVCACVCVCVCVCALALNNTLTGMMVQLFKVQYTTYYLIWSSVFYIVLCIATIHHTICIVAVAAVGNVIISVMHIKASQCS